jgi:hypothetical protein
MSSMLQHDGNWAELFAHPLLLRAYPNRLKIPSQSLTG